MMKTIDRRQAYLALAFDSHLEQLEQRPNSYLLPPLPAGFLHQVPPASCPPAEWVQLLPRQEAACNAWLAVVPPRTFTSRTAYSVKHMIESMARGTPICPGWPRYVPMSMLIAAAHSRGWRIQHSPGCTGKPRTVDGAYCCHPRLALPR
ncbi:MAG: hypothetical protein OXT70_01020 [Chloroflexota bacterium]|nr:hypothetical protein [Chloroflexota bacterium]